MLKSHKYRFHRIYIFLQFMLLFACDPPATTIETCAWCPDQYTLTYEDQVARLRAQINMPTTVDSTNDGTNANVHIWDEPMRMTHELFDGLPLQIDINGVPMTWMDSYISSHGNLTLPPLRFLAPNANIQSWLVISWSDGMFDAMNNSRNSGYHADIGSFSAGIPIPLDPSPNCSSKQDNNWITHYPSFLALIEQDELLLVIGAGNSYGYSFNTLALDQICHQSNKNGLIVAGSVDQYNILSIYSNPATDLFKDIYMVAPTDPAPVIDEHSDQQYKIIDTGGTSYAAPIIAAAAAIIKGRHPSLTNHELQQILLLSATDLGEMGVDNIYGHGLLNVQKAIEYSDYYVSNGTLP